MLPKKAIIAVIIASILLIGYEGLDEKQLKDVPNLLLGFALVGVIGAISSAKDFKQIV